MIETLLFYAFALLILVSAVLTVTTRNIFHSALYLAAALFGVAAVYVLLQAYFLAAVQVLIYIGAVVVLTIFVINLTKEITGKDVPLVSRQTLPAALVAALTAALILLALAKTAGLEGAAPAAAPGINTAVIGTLLLKDYVVPFEVVSVLLLAALIGAIVIVSKEPEEKK
jgi:NADH-quinone oxidoreductase subunit J